MSGLFRRITRSRAGAHGPDKPHQPGSAQGDPAAPDPTSAMGWQHLPDARPDGPRRGSSPWTIGGEGPDSPWEGGGAEPAKPTADSLWAGPAPGPAEPAPGPTPEPAPMGAAPPPDATPPRPEPAPEPTPTPTAPRPTAAMLQVQGGAVAIPAGVEAVDVLPDRPTTRRRGRLRRRLRHLRRVREVLLRDLGGLVFDIHRFATNADRDREGDLISAKLARLAAVDAELRELEERLSEKRPTVLREPGIGGACPNCGELFGSEATFCWRCGLQVDAQGLSRVAIARAPAQQQLAHGAPAPAPAPAPPPPARDRVPLPPPGASPYAPEPTTEPLDPAQEKDAPGRTGRPA